MGSEAQEQLIALHAKIAEAKNAAEEMNQIGRETCSRSLALAITRLEEAMHWTEDAYRKACAG